MKKIWHTISEQQRKKQPVALCLVVGTKGSSPRKTGSKMLVFADGSIQGSIGGGHLEKKVIAQALKQLETGLSAAFQYDLLQQLNMCCGGTVTVYIEPVMPEPVLYIFGAGHTGKALSEMAVQFGFEVFVIDDRKQYLDEIQHPEVNKMPLAHAQVLPSLPFDENTYIAIMTYDHAYDREILQYCLSKPYAYLGMIGSQRKVEVTRKMFLEAGLANQEQLTKVDMPMGLNIHAETPEEIAISIMAKLIDIKNG